MKNRREFKHLPSKQMHASALRMPKTERTVVTRASLQSNAQEKDAALTQQSLGCPGVFILPGREVTIHDRLVYVHGER